MDDLIVVILTLVVAGFGLLGQLKKKKQVPAENDTQKAPQSFWDLIQGEVENPGQETEPKYDDQGFEYESESVGQQFEVQAESPQVRSVPEEEGRSVIRNIETMKTTKPKLKSKVRTEFSLRKAVIYSEILNRKYT